MADTTGYEEAKKRFEKAKEAYEKGRSTASTTEIQRLLKEYSVARRDMVERTPMGALGAGFLRTAGETVTGIPDLLTEAVNWGARKIGGEGVYQAPTLGGLFRQSTGQSEGPKAAELADYYNLPGYTAAAYSVGSLANFGWKAFKDARIAKRADQLLGDLDPVDRNMFQKWMVKGQGSSSPEIAAMLEKVKTNPKYAELFTAMEQEAGKAALKGIKPTGGVQTPEEAATGIAKTIQDKLKAAKDTRQAAGNDSFEKAFKQAGDSAFIETTNTRAIISKLRSQYPDNTNVQAYLTQLEDKLVPSVTVAPSKGTSYVVREAEPSRVIPGAPARVDTRTRTVVEYDSLGLPHPRQVTESFDVAGAPSTTVVGYSEVRGLIPGSAGYTTTQAPVKLTVERLQGFLHEFGKKAEGSDSVVTGLALDDMKRVNSALFGGLQKDLSATTKTATSVGEKKAAGYLIQARDQYKKASEAYDNLISQGVPKWLQSKNINEVTLEDLTKAYKETNPAQRQLFRDWVGDNRAESLKAIDKAVFDDFLSGTYKKLPDGTFAYDLGSLADKWQVLKKTDPNQAGQIADALGVNANEFSKRMKDASVFTRKVQIGAPRMEADVIAGDTTRAVAATVGATSAGYPGAKVADLSMQAVNELFKKRGLTEEQLMKVLLTPEGKDFLKGAALSAPSAKTLESLVAVDKAILPATIPALGPTLAPSAPVEKPLEAAPEWELPPEFGGASSAVPSGTDETQWELPPELSK